MSNYDSNGNLKRSAMEQIIKSGGSVMVNGQTITKVEDLPKQAVKESGSTAPSDTADAKAKAESDAKANADAKAKAETAKAKATK
ncbi:MAG TPA: hypothetical protein DER01_07790 [Phycisphaerales bacterium]|nr:hypothetical protein [Phycisphaerales bacterium]